MDKVSSDKSMNKQGISLVWRIILTAVIPLIIIGLVAVIVGNRNTRNGMEEEIASKLSALVTSVSGSMDMLDSGDWHVEKNKLFKGKVNISDNPQGFYKLVDGGNEELTLVYGKQRMITTIQGDKDLVGTYVSDEVYNEVFKGTGSYTSSNVEINGADYYCYYKALKNGNETVGMIFAGVPCDSVNNYINIKTNVLVAIILVVVTISLSGIAISVFRIKQAVLKANDIVSSLSEGNLNNTVSNSVLSRRDELGVMVNNIVSLQDKLYEVMGQVNSSSKVLNDVGNELDTMASQTSSTADDISHAIEDISMGVVQQAEDVETVSSSIDEIGDMIGDIVDSIQSLNEQSDIMASISKDANNSIEELSVSNDNTVSAINNIGEQVVKTDKSVQRIKETIEVIADIAAQTNLLSLNAAIEAAHAGDRGKGFAVVADEIQKLAEQASNSAKEINRIIKELVINSGEMVGIMEVVKQTAYEQQKKLKCAQEQFTGVKNGIDKSKEETDSIKSKVDICDKLRKQLMDSTNSLSAISEENAASTQETTASMQEFSATVSIMADEANKLKQLSGGLQAEIDYFKTEQGEGGNK